ncbi:MAG: hypothetical protein HYX68_28070 [Planctomycetes bacterium]|nr:hypothetical protein [Planctomycetota bacterium]
MRRNYLASLSLSAFTLFASQVYAGGGQPANPPSVVVRVASLDVLLKNLNLVVKLVGQEEAAHQIEGLVKSRIGKKGLEGIDLTRPIGVYVRFGKTIDEINGAMLVPLVDSKALLNLLDNLGVKYEKDQNGIYTYKSDQNVDVYFRFAKNYLFITAGKTDSIETKNLPDPAKALAIPKSAAISIVARLDQVPEAAKLIALGKLDDVIQTAQKKAQPGETKMQEAFRVAFLREAQRLGGALVRDAREVRFDLDVNDKTKEMTVNLAVSGKPGSDLAKTIQGIANLKSPLAGPLNKDAAFHGAFHLALPDTLNKAFGGVVDEAVKNSLDGIQKPEKKKQAKALFDALMPSAKSGELQVVATVLGPRDGHYAFVGAVKVKEGEKLGKTITEMIKEALNDIPPAERGKIQLDFSNASAIKIHRFQLPRDAKSGVFFDKVAGDDHLHVAFRNDALFVALGKDSLASLKAALAKTDAVASLPFVFDFDVARMAKLMAQNEEQRTLATKLFPPGKTGRLRMTITGGSTLTARLEMQLNVLEFLVKMQKKEQ